MNLLQKADRAGSSARAEQFIECGDFVKDEGKNGETDSAPFCAGIPRGGTIKAQRFGAMLQMLHFFLFRIVSPGTLWLYKLLSNNKLH
jgi:hypothetical protein